MEQRNKLGQFVKGSKKSIDAYKFPKGNKIGINPNSIKTQFKKGHKVFEGTEHTRFKKGLTPWNKNTKGNYHLNISEEERKRRRERTLNNKSFNRTGIKLSEEHIYKSLMRRPMSSLELKFNNIIMKYNLPYKFVGNGEFFIERKNPDFINVNGEKIAIEVYHKKHKEKIGQAKMIGIEKWEKDREIIFNKYGWKLLFFDESEIIEEYIINKLKESDEK